METITVEKMEVYYNYFVELQQQENKEFINDMHIALDLHLDLMEVKKDMQCMNISNSITEIYAVPYLIKCIQEVLGSIRYTQNSLKYFLPENSCFAY